MSSVVKPRIIVAIPLPWHKTAWGQGKNTKEGRAERNADQITPEAYATLSF